MIVLQAVASAQEQPKAWVFQWKSGDVLKYQVQHTTTVEELTTIDKSRELTPIKTVSTVNSVKSWHVTGIKDDIATLELSIASMKQTIRQTVGKNEPVMREIDSEKPEDAKNLSFLGEVILTIEMTNRGELQSVKTPEPRAKQRLEAELPFRMVLPAKVPAVKEAWSRQFALVVPPPLGADDEYKSEQTFTHRGLNGAFAVIGMTTTLKDTVDDATLPAVLPMLWAGDVFFNTTTGQYHGARLKIEKTLAEHAGKGTKYSYTSEYTEALVAPEKPK
jgi:hypothetical protein